MRHGQVAQARQHQQCDDNEDPYRCANPQVFAEQYCHHADEQKAVAKNLYDKVGKKAGQCVDVAVNALDHFAGRTLLVKREIQVEAVLGQVVAQGIGGPPAYIFRQDSAAYGRDLLDGGNADEQQRQARKEVHRSTGQRRIQKTTHDQGVD